ncbi:MAG: glycine-rich protein [Gemmatimonadaceae bacterium]|nr:glycine-rich protein [Gemmatimonadaceae bacterium]
MMPQAVRPGQNVAELGGNPYLLLTREQAAELRRSRAWSRRYIPAQRIGPEREFEIDLSRYDAGYGFSHASVAGVYERANGWDASTPGKIRTYPRLTTCEAFTDIDYRGWAIEFGDYAYVLRGRYAVKYQVTDSPGVEWSIVEFHNFGAGLAVAGRPAIWNDALYVPLVNVSTNALQRFHRLTTQADVVTEVQTLTESGSPTGGTFTVTFPDGVTSTETAAMDFDITAAAMQTELRLIPGLQKVTVSRAGTTTNFVWTVTMTGAPSVLAGTSPPQFTADASGLTGGAGEAITPATSVAGTGDQWDQGPALREARAFHTWRDLLVRADGAYTSTASTDPMTDSNWGAEYVVGDPGRDVLDLAVHGGFLIPGKADGIYSFDESSVADMEVPDLAAVIDEQNTIGMEYSQGYLLVPHRTGLLRWRPGAFSYVGAEQEGYLDGEISRGWGRTMGVASYGKYVFATVNDTYNGRGAVVMHKPDTRRESGLVPHMIAERTGAVEHCAIVSLKSQPTAATSPAAPTDDNAVGTITWSNPGNAQTSNDTYATAAVGTSHYLKALLAADTRIPTDATVRGVKVEIERQAGDVSTAFSYTGAFEDWEVPVGVTSITVDGYGAGTSQSLGGRVQTTLAVTPGESLRVYVGGAGVGSTTTGGFNGGGAPGANAPQAFGGGGATDIRQGGTALADRVVVMGGGGGRGGGFGGSGGGTTGQTAADQFTATGGGGGTQVAGGSGGDAASSGSLGDGGQGDVAGSTGGGGGGYYGGGGGGFNAGNAAGGGGGSSYADPAVTSDTTHTQGYASATGNGALTFTYSGDVVDNVVRLVRGGTVVGDDKAAATQWPSVDTYKTYGGATDMWGTTLTPAQVNAADFGVVLSATVTTGTAEVDHVRMTIHYTAQGSGDPGSYLLVLRLDATKTICTPEVYELPRHGLAPANDPGISHAGSDLELLGPRYSIPSYGVQKTYRAVTLFCEFSPTSNIPGLEVYAAIDGGAEIQLLDSAGATATITTEGVHTLYFPQTSAAVGRDVQVRFYVPATAGEEVDVEVTIRAATLYGVYQPVSTEAIDFVVLLREGMLDDGQRDRRTRDQQKADLEALYLDPPAAPVTYKDPDDGSTGVIDITKLELQEFTFKGSERPELIAIGSGIVQRYA